MKSSPLITTSIAPNHRIELQKQAIKSWLNIGMEVISLNTAEEIEKLQPIFRDITFVPQYRTGQALFGRPYIFISDILNYFRNKSHRICGIINSDISLAQDPNLKTFLYEQAHNSLLYGPRFQVNSFLEENGTLDPLGFDFFIFDRSLISDWAETYFCLGMPSWDHWFPLVSLLCGRNVKKLISQIAFHSYHEVSSDRAVIPFNNEFVSQIIKHFALTERNLSRLDSTRNVVLFNKFQFTDSYNTIIEKIKNDLKIVNDDKLINYKELAIFFDEFTRYSLRFLEKHSKKIEFEC